MRLLGSGDRFPPQNDEGFTLGLTPVEPTEYLQPLTGESLFAGTPHATLIIHYCAEDSPAYSLGNPNSKVCGFGG